MNDRAILSHPYDTVHLPATGVAMEIRAGEGERRRLPPPMSWWR